jgi:hypothetical protein
MGLFDTIGAVAGGIGEYQGAKRAEKAAQQSVAYLAKERKLGQEKAQDIYGEYLPAGGMGMDALQSQYDMLVGGDMSKFLESPGYKFAMEQGTQALERGAAARGGLLGGGQMKELTRYGQGLASQDFGNYLQQLSGLTAQGTNIGMQAGGGIMSQYGGVSPGAISQAMMNEGQAKAFAQSSPWQTGQKVMNIQAEEMARAQEMAMSMMSGGVA